MDTLYLCRTKNQTYCSSEGITDQWRKTAPIHMKNHALEKGNKAFEKFVQESFTSSEQ
jgi:hypothetical protein